MRGEAEMVRPCGEKGSCSIENMEVFGHRKMEDQTEVSDVVRKNMKEKEVQREEEQDQEHEE